MAELFLLDPSLHHVDSAVPDPRDVKRIRQVPGV